MHGHHYVAEGTARGMSEVEELSISSKVLAARHGRRARERSGRKRSKAKNLA